MPPLQFTLNGAPVAVDGVEPHTTLLHYLRSAGLTGAKEGCAEGECGACAVVLRQPGPGGAARYRPVNSCLMPLPAVAGLEVYTVEALTGGGALHPVQSALVEHGGSQCGYCTPGFVMSMFAAHYGPAGAADAEALDGNLCRCTGYRPIRAAAAAVAGTGAEQAAAATGAEQAAADPFRLRLAEPPPEPGTVDYAAGGTRFFRPTRLADLSELLAAHPGARLIAGGTDVGVEITQQFRRWPALISLEAVAELRRITASDAAIELGAALTLTELAEQLDGRVPLLDQLFPLFASPLIRNRATLGGNLATASPIGDGSPVLLALGAELRLVSAAGERLVPLVQFFTGYRRTALAPGEIIAAVRIPQPQPALARFYKVARRLRDDISTVSAAFALDLDGAGRVARARLAYGGVAPTPVRAANTEAALAGRPWNADTLRQVRPVLAAEFTPISDHRGSAAYRQAMVANLLEKFYHETRGALVWKA